MDLAFLREDWERPGGYIQVYIRDVENNVFHILSQQNKK